VQPDLIGLEISKGELRRLTGVSPDTVLRSATIATPENRLKFWQNEILVSLLITSVIVGLGYGLIVAVDVNDQLAVSRELDDTLDDRDKVITALQLLREDLVRAFKTERLLRDNKKLLAENQDLSVNSLNNIPALQANSQASEYTLLLNQALQIALDVQAQLRNLQSSR
jgi:hypothetical protein